MNVYVRHLKIETTQLHIFSSIYVIKFLQLNFMSFIQVQCEQNNAYVNWLEQIPVTVDGQGMCNISTKYIA